MADSIPIFASAPTAARLMDMKVAEFRTLVKKGHLPKPREIAPGVERWDTSELRSITSGTVADGLDDIAW